MVKLNGSFLLYLVLFFTFGAISVTAQEGLLNFEYSYRRYTTQDGLPSMNMESIFKDSKGLLWQATLKGGSSFDGLDFKPYTFDMFTTNRIEEINGKIRFFNVEKMYYPETDSVVALPDSIKINFYNSRSLPAGYYIAEREDGTKCFVIFEDEKIADVIDIPQLKGLNFCKVHLDRQQKKLYIPNNRTSNIYIYDFPTKAIETIEDVVIECFIDHSRLGLLGIGKEGIYKIRNNEVTLYVPLQFEMQNKIVRETGDGSMYITDFYNIYKVNGEKTEHLYRNSSLAIWDMTLDDDENLWVATNKGLFNFFHFDFNNYQIADHTIRAATQDKNGTYWFAGDNEDIFSFSDGILRQVKYPLNYNTQIVSFNSAFSFENITYFLIRGGVLIHENNRFYWAELPHENQSYCYLVEYKDNLLIAGANTIFEITRRGKIVRTITENELQITGYMGLAVDGRNRIIVGGNEGISIVDGDKVTVHKNKTDASIDLICTDGQNHVFMAESKNLNIVTDADFVNIHSFDNDFIMGLLSYEDDYLIISTLKGFYIFNTKKYFESGDVQLLFFNHNNGMDGIEPAFGELFADNNRNVWMVTSEKIVSFEPQKLIRQIAPPNLLLQDAFVSVDNVKWEKVNETGNYSFSYLNKNFRFIVLGLSYTVAENVRYYYRMRGFQNEWSEPTKQREITFNNLPPGNYTFEIYADAGTDESKSDIKSFSFMIVPAFWQTKWFVAAIIIILIFAGASVTLFIQRRKNKKLFEKLCIEKELNELRVSSIRLKAIPHFNANILSALEFYIANRTKEEAIRLLGVYSDFTVETLREVDKAARNLSDELAYVKMYLDLEKIRFMDKFDFRINVDEGVDRNIQLPNMILHTYCENAVKHGLMPLKTGGMISINVSRHEQKVRVSVEDNGVGRAFAKNHPSKNSTKQGLTILNRQIEIYNSFNKLKISQFVDDLIENNVACGTRFTVEVPQSFVYVI